MIFLFLLSFINLWASDCSPVNLINFSKSPFEKIPVYDQNGAGICFAYSAATLVNYELMKNQGEKDLVAHPAWLALMDSMNDVDERVSAGNSARAIQSVNDFVNCDHKEVSAALMTWANKVQITESEILGLIDLYAKNLTTRFEDSRMEATLSVESKDLWTSYEAAYEKLSKICQPQPFHQWSSLFAVLAPLKIVSSREMLTSLLFPTCAPVLNTKKLPKADSNKFFSDSSYKEKIRTTLNTHDPAAFSHCGYYWDDPKTQRLAIGDRSGLKDAKGKDLCGNHEAVVIGKKEVEGSCQYLVRNSWGDQWQKRNQSLKCFCRNRTTNVYEDDCTEKTHSNEFWAVEACWAPEDELVSNMFEVTTVIKGRPQ
jgi:hypothetical protein